MKPILLLLLTTSAANAQRLWTAADQRYTVDNLRRTRNDLTREVENLTDAQWHFRESPERWSIAEVVEHLGTWEIALPAKSAKASETHPAPTSHLS